MLPQIKKLTRITSIFLTTSLFSFLALVLLNTLTNYKFFHPKPAHAQASDPACIGPAVANYMDAVISGVRNANGGAGLPHIKLLSPAFNFTAGGVSHNMIDAILGSSSEWQNLDAIAGNSYNVNNGTITGYINDIRFNTLVGPFPVLLTEIGAFDTDQATLLSIYNEIQSIRSGGAGSIRGVTLFDAFGDNPGFPYHILYPYTSTDQSNIRTVCTGNPSSTNPNPCSSPIGVNSAVFFSGSNDAFYSRAQSLGMSWTVQIANNDSDPSLPQVIPGILNAHSRGITPIIRIGVQNSSGGFDDPLDYVNFLQIIDNSVGQDVYAIAGPNEPMTECWASPQCGCSTTTDDPAGGYIPCDQVSAEPHPLRPYPGSPCGNLESPVTTYCAMRPWAGTNITYLKNKNTCTSGGVCVEQDIYGNYSIDPNSELPLVSVTRDGFDYLTFFNRSQEHHAAYLEGRAHYEIDGEPSITDGINDLVDRISIWNRLGIFRKLAPLSLQNNMKIENIQNAGTFIHDYIISPDPYGALGDPIRMTDFVGHYPPVYQCSSLTDPIENENCKLEFFEEMEEWRESIWGQLWPRVPMVTREDAYGYVSVIPEPSQTGPYGFTQAITGISIPHLPRLDAIANVLRQLLDPFLSEEPQTTPVTGIPQPPADGLANCNPNATAIPGCIFDQSVIQDLANRWIEGPIGNQVDRCYNDVIARAQSSGFNAQLAMRIWLNESNASNYSISPQDFGVNLESLHYNWEAQISQMILLARDIYPNQEPWTQCYGATAPIMPETSPPRRMNEIEAFLWIYRTGFCNTADTDPIVAGYQNPGFDYVNNIRDRWNWFGSCPFPTSPLTASIYPSSTTSEVAGLFPECEAIVPNNVDFNLFTPQIMINNKAG